MCWNHVNSSLWEDSSMGYLVAKKRGFCYDQKWGGYKGRKKNPALKVFMTTFPHYVSHEVFCQFSFHLVDSNHYYFTLYLRKRNYCRPKSYMVTCNWGHLHLEPTHTDHHRTREPMEREEAEGWLWRGRVNTTFASLPPSLRDRVRAWWWRRWARAGGVVFWWKTLGISQPMCPLVKLDYTNGKAHSG